MPAAYVFVCTNKTEKACFKQKLFGTVSRYLPIVLKVKQGDKLFLYNLDSDILYGVFEAASDGAEKISPRAWGGRYPAQVKIKIDFEQLKEISGACRIFPFVRDLELNEEQIKLLLKSFEKAPISGEPIYMENTIPNSEKLFAAFLDEQEIPYVRTSQEIEDFSKVLAKMRAKRPDFLILTKRELVFVEIKPNLISSSLPQIVVNVEEVNKLNQFQLLTGVDVILAFPLDKDGTAWRAMRPSGIVAHGIKRKTEDRDVFVVNVRKTEKIKLPFSLVTPS
ncbi:MAG: hypothetical protein NWF05_05440 [Candidatus Bathyarchaeota archaeon]|nr:hypothetical protein [Candidatus Bathyarchaeota archaeon]